jgi:hypothetical protein
LNMNSSIIGNIASRGLEATLPETLYVTWKKCLILTPMHKTPHLPPLQLIILKHKTTFYTYQKTVAEILLKTTLTAIFLTLSLMISGKTWLKLANNRIIFMGYWWTVIIFFSVLFQTGVKRAQYQKFCIFEK